MFSRRPRRSDEPRWSRVAVATIVGGALLISGGMATASWLANGNGSAGGRAATLSFSVSASTPAAGTGDMYPSASATGSVRFNVTNPNNYTIRVTGVAPNGSATSADTVNCPSANVTIGTVSGLSGGAYDVGANSTVTITVPNVLTMAAAAPNGCQDVAFTIPLTVTAST